MTDVQSIDKITSIVQDMLNDQFTTMQTTINKLRSDNLDCQNKYKHLENKYKELESRIVILEDNNTNKNRNIVQGQNQSQSQNQNQNQPSLSSLDSALSPSIKREINGNFPIPNLQTSNLTNNPCSSSPGNDSGTSGIEAGGNRSLSGSLNQGSNNQHNTSTGSVNVQPNAVNNNNNNTGGFNLAETLNLLRGSTSNNNNTPVSDNTMPSFNLGNNNNNTNNQHSNLISTLSSLMNNSASANNLDNTNSCNNNTNNPLPTFDYNSTQAGSPLNKRIKKEFQSGTNNQNMNQTPPSNDILNLMQSEQIKKLLSNNVQNSLSSPRQLTGSKRDYGKVFSRGSDTALARDQGRSNLGLGWGLILGIFHAGLDAQLLGHSTP